MDDVAKYQTFLGRSLNGKPILFFSQMGEDGSRLRTKHNHLVLTFFVYCKLNNVDIAKRNFQLYITNFLNIFLILGLDVSKFDSKSDNR